MGCRDAVARSHNYTILHMVEKLRHSDSHMPRNKSEMPRNKSECYRQTPLHQRKVDVLKSDMTWFTAMPQMLLQCRQCSQASSQRLAQVIVDGYVV